MERVSGWIGFFSVFRFEADQQIECKTASDGSVTALGDAGKSVGSIAPRGGVEGVPAVYQAAGRQFIAVPTGGNGIFQPRASANSPIPPTATPQYVVFALPKK